MDSLPFDRILSTTFFMSPGATNWPFLTLTGLPVAAAARSRSVWRHRNAGIWSTSSTSAAIGPIWTSRVAIIGAGSACPAQTVGGLPEMVLGSVRSSPCPVLQARFHEAGEQRMRLPRPRPELGVELAGHEVGMILDLDDLDELFLRPQTRHAQAVLLEGLEVVVVDLVPVAVTLTDHRLGPVEARSHRALGHQDGIEAQPHGAALVGERPLLGQEIDHEVRRAGGE